MDEYPQIRHALSTIFSIGTGLPDDAAMAVFKRSLADGNLRHELEQELESAFASPSTPWRNLLSNEEYEVFEAETDTEARNFIAETLLKPLRSH
jgi:hypothetical protein